MSRLGISSSDELLLTNTEIKPVNFFDLSRSNVTARDCYIHLPLSAVLVASEGIYLEVGDN